MKTKVEVQHARFGIGEVLNEMPAHLDVLFPCHGIVRVRKSSVVPANSPAELLRSFSKKVFLEIEEMQAKYCRNEIAVKVLEELKNRL